MVDVATFGQRALNMERSREWLQMHRGLMWLAMPAHEMANDGWCGAKVMRLEQQCRRVDDGLVAVGQPLG